MTSADSRVSTCWNWLASTAEFFFGSQSFMVVMHRECIKSLQVQYGPNSLISVVDISILYSIYWCNYSSNRQQYTAGYFMYNTAVRWASIFPWLSTVFFAAHQLNNDRLILAVCVTDIHVLIRLLYICIYIILDSYWIIDRIKT